MLTSKERAELRGKANGLETTLMVGKGGVTEQVIGETVTQLEARELVKGRVLEAALLSPQEVLEELCRATGADPVCTVGSRFVLYRQSEKLRQERNRVGRAKLTPVSVAKSNPVRKGAQARRKAARAERERRNEYFRQSAIEKSIEREKEKSKRREERS